jgi:hypothetical protein
MTYADLNFQDFRKKFGYENRLQELFSSVKSVKASNRLIEELKDAENFRLHSKKAKSEWIIVPILRELCRLNPNFLTVYSGESLDINIENGLSGVCDFILAKDIRTYTISYPLVQIVEAPEGDIDLGVAQCAAQMIGSKIYNEQNNTPIDIIYGCVTSGSLWLFLQLSDKIFINNDVYYTSNLNELLGVFQSIIDYYKETLK